MQKEVKGYWDQLYIEKMLLQEVKRRKKNLVIEWISYWKSLWHGPPLLGGRELKYDGDSKKCGEFFVENDQVLEGGAKLWCWDTWGSTSKERDFSRWCAINITVCNCPRTADTHPGYEFQTGETINHLLILDDLKLYSKSERALDSLI